MLGGITVTCLTCGLLEQGSEPYFCLRFKKEISSSEARGGAGENCIYYFKTVSEDGEPLTPKQHLIIQDQDFRSKKMQGPMK